MSHNGDVKSTPTPPCFGAPVLRRQRSPMLWIVPLAKVGNRMLDLIALGNSSSSVRRPQLRAAARTEKNARLKPWRAAASRCHIVQGSNAAGGSGRDLQPHPAGLSRRSMLSKLCLEACWRQPLGHCGGARRSALARPGACCLRQQTGRGAPSTHPTPTRALLPLRRMGKGRGGREEGSAARRVVR